MPAEYLIQVSPETAAHDQQLLRAVARHAQLTESAIAQLFILRRSVDARQKQVKINLKVQVFFQEEPFIKQSVSLPNYPFVGAQPEVLVIGAGPAGLFAALQLIECNIKPIIIERGKDVRGRRRDLKAINIDHVVDPDSNYCFGEGGAGTYSDGKLYTRSKKRGDVDRILQLFVAFGASPEILVDAHPHIGTNKLPKIISDMRDTILACGGEVHFETRVTDLIIQSKQIRGIVTQKGITFKANQVILATGHSARDIFELLDRKQVYIEPKPFAIGVRAEHPQALIDSMQYRCTSRGPYLPPAPYSIVKQINGRGMYSFCMCPGGVIAPCATAPGEVVTNGWSPSKRDQLTANAGIVVELTQADFKPYKKHGALAGLALQRQIEQQAWLLAGQTQRVPAQRMVDFNLKKVSTQLPKTSYVPGLTAVELGEVFPSFISEVLRSGFVTFGKSMPGYYTNEAILHAPESRTSSPVRIPRDPETLQHLQISGLYPCGEGAGYAGGIVSAAIDGEKCARMVAQSLKRLL